MAREKEDGRGRHRGSNEDDGEGFRKAERKIGRGIKYDRREFGLWVELMKAPQSVMEAFLEFEHHFSQLSDPDQESVGADRVILFFKSVNEKGIITILPELEDDEGTYGLTEDWNEVEWVC